MTRPRFSTNRSLRHWVLLLKNQMDKEVTKNGEEERESNSYCEND